MSLRRLGLLLCPHSALFFLLTPCCVGQYEMVGAPQPVLAWFGEDVVLPCRLLPAADLSAHTVEWARSDLTPRFVHLRRDGVELLVSQHPSYMGRAELSGSRLKHGDVSLRLSSVRLSDEGTYRCHVPDKASAHVQLRVGAAPHRVAVTAQFEASSVLLRCRSAGWYPEPELLWLDADGAPLAGAAPAETLRGPDGLYSIGSTASVQRSGGSAVTCSVRQSLIAQSRAAEIHLQGDVAVEPARPAARLAIVSVTAVAFAALVALLLCRRTRDRGGQEEKAESAALLDEKEEERRSLVTVIQHLQEQREELQRAREQQESQLTQAEMRRRENDEKLHNLNHSVAFDKTAKTKNLQSKQDEVREELKSWKASLQATVTKIHHTNSLIRAMEALKTRAETRVEQIGVGGGGGGGAGAGAGAGGGGGR